MKFEPKKSLGQNFLVNEKIYHFMVEEIAPQKDETIIEVGPGEGVLTEYLAKSGAQVVAVEKDHRLVPILKEKFKDQKNVTIIEEDILKFDPLNYKLEARNYKLIGNIPYYLTSHLLRVVLEDWPKPKLILFMVQKEVAQRMVAKNPDMNPERSREGSQRASASIGMNLLALSVQFFAEAKIVKYVSKGNFSPAPKVDSALVKIIPKEKFTYDKLFQKNFFQLAQAAFQNKRKQILNSLVHNLKLDPEGVASRPYGASKNFIAEKLAKAGIEPNRRPESLNLNEWEKLAKLLFQEQRLFGEQSPD